MATTRKAKEANLASLTEDLKSAKGLVFTEYRGMTVKQLDQVRKKLRAENVKYQVIKVTLLKKALQALGIKIDGLKYTGPLAIAASTIEETAPARILKLLTKDFPQLVLDGGIFNQELVGSDVVIRLASLPSKDQLRGQLVTQLALLLADTWLTRLD